MLVLHYTILFSSGTALMIRVQTSDARNTSAAHRRGGKSAGMSSGVSALSAALISSGCII